MIERLPERLIVRSGPDPLDRFIRLLVRLLLLCFLFVLQAAGPLHGSEHPAQRSAGMPEAPLPTRAQISHAIALSAGYLERACGPDGKFTYSIDIRSGRESRSYNIVRHA